MITSRFSGWLSFVFAGFGVVGFCKLGFRSIRFLVRRKGSQGCWSLLFLLDVVIQQKCTYQYLNFVMFNFGTNHQNQPRKLNEPPKTGTHMTRTKKLRVSALTSHPNAYLTSSDQSCPTPANPQTRACPAPKKYRRTHETRDLRQNLKADLHSCG